MNKLVAYYSVCDSVAGMFGPMFPAINDDVAKRMFRNLLKDVDNLNEYQLFKVGMFNQECGKFVPDQVFVCDGNEALEVK